LGHSDANSNRKGKASETVSEAHPPVATDTVAPAPIKAKPCNSYTWFQANAGNWESEGYTTGIGGTLSSLHELTCKWAAYQRGLNLDSTRLPEYVRPLGDSLRLPGGALAYNVRMTDSTQSDSYNVLYFVAEVEDSLFYRRVDEQYYNPDAEQSWQIRALRSLDVPKASAQYVWLEYNSIAVNREDGDRHVSESWTGHIYTYDDGRGFRFLQWAPIRSEIRKNGKLIGAKQWDVSVPEAGYMRVEKRLEKGKDLTLEPPEHWLGLHVIDSTAAGTGSVRPSCD
jgi:hypothetical protein